MEGYANDLGSVTQCTNPRSNSLYRGASAALLLVAAGVSAIVVPDSKIPAYNAPPTIPPITGATQNNQSCAIAHPPTRIAGPVLLAGFTDRFVTGIPMR